MSSKTTIEINKDDFNSIASFYTTIINKKIYIIHKIAKKYNLNKKELVEKYIPEYKVFKC